MDGFVLFVLIILGSRILPDMFAGKLIGEYTAGIIFGWAVVHSYYCFLRRKKNNYPTNWDELRKDILRRDNYTCCNCLNTNKKLHVHHIVPLTRGGTNEPTNLATLCERCHIQLHPHMR